MSKKTDDKPHAIPPVPKTVAVALDYEPHNPDDAPKVIAKGKGYVAQRILEIAFEKGIRVREDADLAQMLAAVDLESEIPIEAYLAVAEILAYVYKANNQLPPGAEAKS